VIAVDTSALMAIILDEPQAASCIAALEAEEEILVSAGTVAEALIVSGRRNVGGEMTSLIDGLGFDIVTITPAAARRIAAAYGDGEGTSIRQVSIWATVSPTRWRRNTTAACSTLARSFQRPMSRAFFEEGAGCLEIRRHPAGPRRCPGDLPRGINRVTLRHHLEAAGDDGVAGRDAAAVA
jgi:predicted nucleic acid-binding protein